MHRLLIGLLLCSALLIPVQAQDAVQGTILVQAMGPDMATVRAKLCTVIDCGGSGGVEQELTLAQAIESIWTQMGTVQDFQVHAATRELTFTTNVGGIPATRRVSF